MKDDRFYLVYMIERIANIEEDTAQGAGHFSQNRTIRDAVMRNLQTLAESSMRISAELKATCPEVEWGQIRNFRHVAVHDYTEIDYDLIWRIVETQLPPLKMHLQRILAERPHS